MPLYRFTDRNDPRDGTESILAREASGNKPEARLLYDPDGQYPGVDLTEEEAGRVREFVGLTEVSEEESAAAPAEVAVADPAANVVATPGSADPGTFTEEELDGKSASEVKDIAKKRSVDGADSNNKGENIAAILKAQEGGA